MVLADALLERFLLSSAMVYFLLGYALGPGWMGVISPDPLRHAHALGLVARRSSIAGRNTAFCATKYNPLCAIEQIRQRIRPMNAEHLPVTSYVNDRTRDEYQKLRAGQSG